MFKINNKDLLFATDYMRRRRINVAFVAASLFFRYFFLRKNHSKKDKRRAGGFLSVILKSRAKIIRGIFCYFLLFNFDFKIASGFKIEPTAKSKSATQKIWLNEVKILVFIATYRSFFYFSKIFYFFLEFLDETVRRIVRS